MLRRSCERETYYNVNDNRIRHISRLTKGNRVKPGVDSDGLLDDKTILDELADVLARVGVGNLVDLVGVQPHLWSQSQASDVGSFKSSAPCSCRTS